MMKTKFTFYKNRNYLTENICDWHKGAVSLVIGLIMTFGYNINTKAQTALRIPNSNEGSAFIGPFGNAARQL